MPLLTNCVEKDSAVRSADKDVFHAYMVNGARFSGTFDFPILKRCIVDVEGLVSFPDAMSRKNGSSVVCVGEISVKAQRDK